MLRIIAPHFVAGIELNKYNKGVRTAPILSYMVNWAEQRIRDYCARKGWSVEEVKG